MATKAVDKKYEMREVTNKRGIILNGQHHVCGAVIEIDSDLVPDLVKRGILSDKSKGTRTREVKAGAGTKRAARKKAATKNKARSAKTLQRTKKPNRKAPKNPPPEVADPEPKVSTTLDMTRSERLSEDVTSTVMPSRSPNMETSGLTPEPAERTLSNAEAMPLMESRGGAETRVVDNTKAARDQKTEVDKKKSQASKK